MSGFDAEIEEDMEEDWTDTNWCEEVLAPKHENEEVSIHNLKQEAIDIMRQEGSSHLSRMKLNDNKAGMENLDRDRINKIIFEASKGSRFFENERKKEELMNKRIEEQRKKLAKITEEELKQGEQEADCLLNQLEFQRKMNSTIVHIDMDAFYAAVEIKDNPSLQDKPMAVGSISMLCTSNYDARRYGVRAAMPGFIARKLCPQLVILPPNFRKYSNTSKQVQKILSRFDANFCMMSLDEAYLDITDHLKQRSGFSEEARMVICRNCEPLDAGYCQCDPNERPQEFLLPRDGVEECLLQVSAAENVQGGVDGDGADDDLKKRGSCLVCKKMFSGFTVQTFGLSADEVVKELRCRILQRTGLTASAGIAPNMMLSKVCSDRNKPNGQFRIEASRTAVMDFAKDLPIRKICGIGKVTERMLNALGIVTCSHLYKKRAILYHLYSSISFSYFMRISLGIGSVTVERNQDSERKSISTERTFSDTSNVQELYDKCLDLCKALSEDLKQHQYKGKTVGLKLKTSNFELKTRAQTLPDYTADKELIYKIALNLLKSEIQACCPHPLELRLMGVRMSTLLHQSLCSTKQQNTITGIFKKLESKLNKTNKVEIDGTPSFTDPTVSCIENIPNDYDSVKAGRLVTSSDSLSCSYVLEPKTTDDAETDKDKSFFFCHNDLPERSEIVLKEVNSTVESDESTNGTTGHTNSEDLTSTQAHVETSNGSSLSFPDSVNGDYLLTEESTTVTDFSLGNISGTNEEFSETLTESKLVCPVCQEEQPTADLNEFNAHIDCCLEQIDSNKEVAVCDQGSNIESETRGRNTKSAAAGMLLGETSDKYFAQTADCEEQDDCSLVCPICGNQSRQNNLLAFNEHVDLCLNKITIKEILKEQDRNFTEKEGLKRSSTEPASRQVSKRKKNTGGGKNKTIDSFFPTTPPAPPKTHTKNQ